MKIANNFAIKIIEHKGKTGLTYPEIAKGIGIHTSTLKLIINGTTKVINDETAEKINNYLTNYKELANETNNSNKINKEENKELIKLIIEYKKEKGLTYPELAKRIGISLTTLEHIVYEVREGSENTKEKIYNYIIANKETNNTTKENRENKEERIEVEIENNKDKYKIKEINKSEHKELGLIYIVEMYNKKEERIVRYTLLEKEIIELIAPK